MRTIFTYIILLVFLTGIANASATEYVPGELLVRFAPKPDGSQMMTAEREQILASVGGGTITQSFRIVSGLTLVKLPVEITVEDALKTFKNADGILNVQPNYILHATSTYPNDTYFANGSLWGLHNTGQNDGSYDADIDAPEAWDTIHDACDIIVAVVDSGVDYNHPDLAPNMWTDANGYHGYDFCTCSDYYCTNSSKSRDPYPLDDHGHGTHCAGIIGAKGNNSTGITGVCWNAKIMALKFLNYAGYGKTSDAIAAIGYAVNNGAKILNNSWGGGGYSEELENAIEAANDANVLFIAAAGNSDNNNDANPVYPTTYDCSNIISVMATDRSDVRSVWPPYYTASSNYGATSVDLGAPGTDILSTVPGNAYRFYQGTSMAAPHVAGACALVWAANPNLTHLQVKDAIMSSVDVLPSLSFPQICVTGGRLNLYNAVSAVSPIYLTQIDDANAKGVKPGYRLTYTITYNYTTLCQNPLTNVVLTDYLPAEVLDTNVVPSGTSDYNSTTHTVTWNLGTLYPGDSNSVTVVVTVGSTRPSTGYLGNTAKITAAETNVTTFTRWTRWYYRVHNVTKNWWYDVIQSAITAADNNDTLVVYPGTYTENVIFDGNVLTLQSSDPNDPSIVASTVITGFTGYAITFNNNSSMVSGFTLSNSGYGVYCYYGNATPTIANCVIRNNTNNGVYCYNLSAPTIANCIIKDNQSAGIRCGYTGQVKIRDNLIVNNGSYGVFIDNPNNEVTVRNNTISNNTSGGIYRSGVAEPNISNCIIWYNGIANFAGATCNNVNYCCINGGYSSGTGNIPYDPCFVDVNASDYHLKFGSLCRNNGDPNTTLDINETDIDGQPRRNGTTRAVDIGGDEYYGSTDLNGDWQVNFLDYAIFANAWYTHAGIPKWNALCDFIDNNNIDINDLAWFAQDWYFPPADQQGQMDGMGMGEGMGEYYMGEQQFMMDQGEGEEQTPLIYMTCDTNMPEPNEEVTVYVHCDTPLYIMEIFAAITGDVNVTAAMSSADCNQYGWDPSWQIDPYLYLDDFGFIYFGGIAWPGQTSGTVGYFKFIYHGGQVTVSFITDEDTSTALSADCEYVPFSTDVLTIGLPDPNNP